MLLYNVCDFRTPLIIIASQILRFLLFNQYICRICVCYNFLLRKSVIYIKFTKQKKRMHQFFDKFAGGSRGFGFGFVLSLSVNVVFSCWVTRMKVVLLLSSRNSAAPT